jgi:hypothetical protein
LGSPWIWAITRGQNPSNGSFNRAEETGVQKRTRYPLLKYQALIIHGNTEAVVFEVMPHPYIILESPIMGIGVS